MPSMGVIKNNGGGFLHRDPAGNQAPLLQDAAVHPAVLPQRQCPLRAAILAQNQGGGAKRDSVFQLKSFLLSAFPHP